MGRATALALARAGAGVAVIDAEAERAEAVAAEVRDLGHSACTISADVTAAEEAVRGVVEARLGLGGLEIVVNIVGSASWAPLLELDEETWERDFAVNLKHHWYVARSAARAWIDAGEHGVLCVVGSVSGLSTCSPAPRRRLSGSACGSVDRERARPRPARCEWSRPSRGPSPTGR